jgi:hypothetical protein
VRFYLYISDTKLDMLFPQIPSATRDSLVKEFKFDLKVVSLSLREQPSDETRYSKLKVVSEYLEEEASSVDKPAAYFKGRLTMKWGPLGGEWRESEAVYFAGATDETVVGLGGSARHVIGTIPGGVDNTFLWPASAVAALVPVLEQEALGAAEREAKIMKDSYGHLWPMFVYSLGAMYRGPEQEVEFLARRLLYGPPGCVEGTNSSVLLGTPIYVAAAD